MRKYLIVLLCLQIGLADAALPALAIGVKGLLQAGTIVRTARIVFSLATAAQVVRELYDASGAHLKQSAALTQSDIDHINSKYGEQRHYGRCRYTVVHKDGTIKHFEASYVSACDNIRRTHGDGASVSSDDYVQLTSAGVVGGKNWEIQRAVYVPPATKTADETRKEVQAEIAAILQSRVEPVSGVLDGKQVTIGRDGAITQTDLPESQRVETKTDAKSETAKSETDAKKDAALPDILKDWKYEEVDLGEYVQDKVDVKKKVIKASECVADFGTWNTPIGSFDMNFPIICDFFGYVKPLVVTAASIAAIYILAQ